MKKVKRELKKPKWKTEELLRTIKLLRYFYAGVSQKFLMDLVTKKKTKRAKFLSRFNYFLKKSGLKPIKVKSFFEKRITVKDNYNEDTTIILLNPSRTYTRRYIMFR